MAIYMKLIKLAKAPAIILESQVLLLYRSVLISNGQFVESLSLPTHAE